MSASVRFEIRSTPRGILALAEIRWGKDGRAHGPLSTIPFPDEAAAIAWVAEQFLVLPDSWAREPEGLWSSSVADATHPMHWNIRVPAQG